MIDKEYQEALRSPSPLDLLRLRKKLTVTGTSGNTQGVTTANSPAIRQNQKVDQRELSSAGEKLIEWAGL
jgi:hypothetical protein